MTSIDASGAAHCSISDIIDVLKSQQEQEWENSKRQDVTLGKNSKDDASNSISVFSPPVSPELWRPKPQASKQSFDFSSKARYSVVPKLQVPSLRHDQGTTTTSSDEESILNAASVLANGLANRSPATLTKYNLDPTNAVIIMLDEDSKVHLMSTSREQLEGYLEKSQSEMKTKVKDENKGMTGSRATVIHKCGETSDGTQQEDSHTSTGSESDIAVQRPSFLTKKVPQKKVPQKRGRKRINGGDEGDFKHAEMKRERNNQACRKFRQTKKMKQTNLMETESTLIEKNLNLKQEIVSLQRQLKEIKARLGIALNEEN